MTERHTCFNEVEFVQKQWCVMKTSECWNQKVCRQTQETSRNTASKWTLDSTKRKENEQRLSRYQYDREVRAGLGAGREGMLDLKKKIFPIYLHLTHRT